MSNIRNALDLEKRNTLRMGILLLSTLGIILGTALVFSRLVYEQSLAVGGSGGGSGSIGGLDTFAPVLTVVLVFSGIVVGPSLFIIFRQKFTYATKPDEHTESLEPTAIFSPPQTVGEPESAASLENEDDAMKMIRDILHPNKEQSTTSE